MMPGSKAPSIYVKKYKHYLCTNTHIKIMNSNVAQQKVVFLDRDGVINIDSENYVKTWSEFEFIQGSLEAINLLSRHQFVSIIITNQSMINRKIAPIKELEYIHSMMKEIVKSRGGHIKDIFFCPHKPEDRCHCRKPKPGLILEAQKRYDIDLGSSVMIGDSVKDIESARNAGCGKAILVKTGKGRESEKLLAEKEYAPDFIANDLLEAVTWIINSHIKAAPFI